MIPDPTPPSGESAPPSLEEIAGKSLMDKLLWFGRRWKLDGDTMVCRGCRRAIHVNRDKEGLHHGWAMSGDDCPNAESHHPWSALGVILNGMPGFGERTELRARLATVQSALAEAAAEIPCAGPVAHRIRVMREEHAAEIARLTAEREDLRCRLEEMGRLVDFSNRTTDSTLARAARAEEEARRYREALGELVAAVDALDATNLLAPEWDAMKARYNAAVLDARRALTEGADHAE